MWSWNERIGHDFDWFAQIDDHEDRRLVKWYKLEDAEKWPA
jgi:hypothetical protein